MDRFLYDNGLRHERVNIDIAKENCLGFDKLEELMR